MEKIKDLGLEIKKMYLIESNIELRISFFTFCEVSNQLLCESERLTTQFLFSNFRERFVF